jgi:hypothetical protein
LRNLKIIAGPCVTPVINGDVARVVKLAGGRCRIEWWVKDTGWTAAPDGAFTLGDFVPGDANRPVLAEDAARLGCRLQDFGRHWTEEPASTADSNSPQGVNMAAGVVPPGHA